MCPLHRSLQSLREVTHPSGFRAGAWCSSNPVHRSLFKSDSAFSRLLPVRRFAWGPLWTSGNSSAKWDLSSSSSGFEQFLAPSRWCSTHCDPHYHLHYDGRFPEYFNGAPSCCRRDLTRKIHAHSKVQKFPDIVIKCPVLKAWVLYIQMHVCVLKLTWVLVFLLTKYKWQCLGSGGV